MTAIPAVTIKAIIGVTAASVVLKEAKDLTSSFDGKTIRSTNREDRKSASYNQCANFRVGTDTCTVQYR